MTEKAFFPCGENDPNLSLWKINKRQKNVGSVCVYVCVCFDSEKNVKAPLTTARFLFALTKAKNNELHVSSKGSAEIMTAHRMERLSSCTASQLVLQQEKIQTPRAGRRQF